LARAAGRVTVNYSEILALDEIAVLDEHRLSI
jgi:hypothetical protein